MQNENRYLGVIPARAGSKGIPRKNMIPLGDRPMLQYTFEAALGSRRLDRTLFTSDDEKMIELARRLGIEAPFRRPTELATDSAAIIDVVLHALDWLRREQDYHPDVVVLLQPTCPFRTATDVDNAILKYELCGRETLLSVSAVLQHPCEMVTVVGGRLTFAVPPPKSGQSGRQAYPTYYFIDGALYIASEQYLRKNRNFYDQESAIHILDPGHGLDIDDPYQLRLARGFLHTQNEA